MSRRVVLSLVVLGLVVAALVWMLSTAYPTLWCSIIGTCNA